MKNTTKKNTTKKNTTLGVDNLVDNTFTPDMQDKEQKPITLADLFSAGYTVSCKHPGTPDEGLHEVTLDGEPTIHNGQNGAYLTFELVEKKTGICWKTFVSAINLTKALEEISYNNHGMLAGKPGLKALQFLLTRSFNCWTLQTEKGSTATYFSEEKFSKRIYAMEMNRERQRPEASSPEAK